MRTWSHAEATAALPDVRARVQRVRELAAEVRRHAAAVGGNGQASSANGHGPAATPQASSELRELLAWFDERGIVVRDAERGLVDFPARSATGRDYLLCWLDGEETIDWWHWPDAGFAGRTPLTQPPD